jgi:hypothetical protein
MAASAGPGETARPLIGSALALGEWRMLYRKSSQNPPTLLLRIVATAGATAVLAACGGEAFSNPDADAGGTEQTGPCGGGPCGSVAMPSDSGDVGHVVTGLVANPPDAGGSPGPCNGRPCGVVVMPTDAGEAAAPHGPCNGGPCGVVVMPTDAGEASAPHGPCNGGPCGVVVMPTDAGDASAPYGPCNGGPCGVVVMPTDAGDASAPHGPCNGGPCGVVVMPTDAEPLDAGPHAGGCPPGFPGICVMLPDAG